MACCEFQKNLSIQSTPYGSPVARIAHVPCADVGLWVENTMHSASRPVFLNMDIRSVSPMTMNIYETKETFFAASGCGNSSKARGITSFSENKICILLDSKEWKKNACVLRHELMHAWLHQQFEPLEMGSKYRTIPKWVHEGMAACFEEEADEQGRLWANQARLRHLKVLIRSGQCPKLASLLEQKESDCFSSNDYAAAWGMIWILLHEDCDTTLRTRIRIYVEDYRENILPERDRIKRFERHLLDEGETLEIWEERWKRKILNIGRFPF